MKKKKQQKKASTRSARGNLRLEIGYKGPERPPIPVSKLNRIEADISDRLSRLEKEGVVAAEKCSGAFCYSKVEGVRQAFAAFDINLRCKISKCSWVRGSDGRWKRVCSLDCSSGSLTVRGTVS